VACRSWRVHNDGHISDNHASHIIGLQGNQRVDFIFISASFWMLIIRGPLLESAVTNKNNLFKKICAELKTSSKIGVQLLPP
jgi:hypothetical protein